MTIEKQMKREDLVALIRERERKERIREAADDLYAVATEIQKAILYQQDLWTIPIVAEEHLRVALAKARGWEQTT